jgi:ferric-dicitrate binding protein FerR (iron transport regulator)
MTHTTRLAGSLALALTLGLAAAAAAQPPAAGDVRRVEGTAAVVRAATPGGVPVKVGKDNGFVRVLLTTGEQSKAQLVLGGKAIVTMREQSALRITETPGTSTVEITDGLLKLAVNKDRMKPSDRIDVRTPNAITAVRGTTIVVEVVRTPAAPPTTPPTTRLTVLEGFVEITLLDPATGRPRGAPLRVNALQQTTVNGVNPPTPPQSINRNAAVQLDASFAFKLVPTASDDVLKRQLEQAASDAAKAPQGAGKLPTSPADTTPNVSGDDLRSRTNVPQPPPPPRGGRTSGQ